MKKRTILYADEGKLLTDGRIYGRIVYLSAGRSESDFTEISEEEYLERMTIEEAKQAGEAMT